ncbi:MAG: glycosyltransferase [Nitrosomonadales bacterium]|nr:glycosyltransferase [Nitrosomonadales bacterium]
MPFITIVVAVYNGAKTLQQCIDSIANQVYSHKELIVMDGASKDATVSILERNNSQIAFWESSVDRGIAHAWNKALEHAKGDWVLFLGADDRLWDARVLSDIAEALQDNDVDDVVYGEIIFEGGAVNGLVAGGPSNSMVLKRRMVIPHTAAFHRRTFFDEVGRYDETFKMAMDYELLLRKKSFSPRFVSRRVTVMGGEGLSSRLIKKTFLEGRSAQIKNKVDLRIRIEAWHAFYQLRHLINLWRKGTSV